MAIDLEDAYNRVQFKPRMHMFMQYGISLSNHHKWLVSRKI